MASVAASITSRSELLQIPELCNVGSDCELMSTGYRDSIRAGHTFALLLLKLPTEQVVAKLAAKQQFSAQTQRRTAPARLAELTQQTTLDMCVATNPSQLSDELPASLLADTLEAVLAAVWIDCGCDINVWTPVAGALGVSI